MATKGELITGVLDALVRPELESQARNFWLPSANSLINRQLRTNEMVRRAIMGAASYLVTLPPDYASHKALNVNNTNEGGVIAEGLSRGSLDYISPHDMNDVESQPFYDTEISRPMRYTVEGKELRLWPRLGFPIQLELVYYAKLPIPATDTGSNWLMDEIPELYFDAMRIFGHRYLLEFDEADRYEASVMGRIMTMNVEAEQAQYTGSRLIMPSTRGYGAASYRRR